MISKEALLSAPPTVLALSNNSRFEQITYEIKIHGICYTFFVFRRIMVFECVLNAINLPLRFDSFMILDLFSLVLGHVLFLVQRRGRKTQAFLH